MKSTFLNYDVSRISGHEQNLKFRTFGQRPINELFAVQARHHHVCQQQIDLSFRIADDFQCRLGVVRCQRLIIVST